ncbi:hypothetical protein K449DRAFT_433585 [Hypoxylon sp. EC38]|nr:hypothetical protein K449DRAFT_433585 [Hypoxylon sp. EC38]
MGLSHHAKAVVAACLLAFSAQASTTTTSSLTTRGSITSTPSSDIISSTSATPPSGPSSSNIPGVTSLPDVSIILNIVPTRDSPDRKDTVSDKKGTVFIDATRPINPSSCTGATPFNLTAGRLSSNGEYLSIDRDVLYKPFGVSSRPHPIATTFSVVDGFLRWYNDGFYRGRARYCQVASTGLLYVAFHIDKTWPAGCEEVDVAVHLAAQCQGGEIVPGGPILPTGLASTTGFERATGTGTGTGAGTIGGGGGGGGSTPTVAKGSWDEL